MKKFFMAVLISVVMSCEANHQRNVHRIVNIIIQSWVPLATLLSYTAGKENTSYQNMLTSNGYYKMAGALFMTTMYDVHIARVSRAKKIPYFKGTSTAIQCLAFIYGASQAKKERVKF